MKAEATDQHPKTDGHHLKSKTFQASLILIFIVYYFTRKKPSPMKFGHFWTLGNKYFVFI